MKNNKVQYGRMLGAIGTQALAVILLPIFMGCATKQAVKNALDSTVRLVMQDANGKYLEVGSGFFVRPDLIATNLYVMKDALRGDTQLVDANNLESLSGYARLVGKDTKYNIESIVSSMEHRLVLLEVTAPGVEPLSLGDSDAVQHGTSVYAVGNPSESGDMFSKGIATHRKNSKRMITMSTGSTTVIDGIVIHGPYSYSSNIEWIELTSQISQKGSGGPVLNDKGKVIGVSSHRGVSNNCAISSKTLEAFLLHKTLLDLVKPQSPRSNQN